AIRRRLVRPRINGQQRIFDRKSFGRLADHRVPSFPSRISTGRAVPVEESTRGRLVVCQITGGGITALFRWRLPTWRRSMDFSRRHKLGHDGADAGFASSRGQFNIQRANSLALAVMVKWWEKEDRLGLLGNAAKF